MDNRTPETKREGEVSAVKMLGDLKRINWHNDSPAKSMRFVDARLRETAAWPAAARQGFNRVVSDWLTTGVLGCAYNVDGYAKHRRVEIWQPPAA